MNLYHATDSQNVDLIIKNIFYCKRNVEHWLGNGIYFFSDINLAKWWAEKPTNKFGCSKINKPSIICIQIKEVEDLKVLDLRNLADYRECVQLFKDFYSVYIKHAIKTDIKKLRCAFFDALFETMDYDIIIGTFLTNQVYLQNFKDDVFDKFELCYFEAQFCINQNKQEHIIKKKVEV